MISNNEFKAIAELDLDPIKVKLMHKESGEGWTLDYANAIEFEYRRFLYLMKVYPNEPAAPLFDVDVFWHYHILDTMKYVVDCDTVFGYFLHHFPYVGLRDEEDEVTHERAGVRMQELYEATFCEPYLRATPGGTDAASSFSLGAPREGVAEAGKTAFSWVVGPQAVAAAGKTAFSWVVGPQAVASAKKTAFSWVVGPQAVASAKKTAFSWVVGPQAVAAAAMPTVACPDTPVDLAALRRLYFERPVLAAT